MITIRIRCTSLYMALSKQTYDWKSINLNRSRDTFANGVSFSAMLVQEGAVASFDDDHNHNRNRNRNHNHNHNHNQRSHSHNHNHNSMAAPATLSVV